MHETFEGDCDLNGRLQFARPFDCQLLNLDILAIEETARFEELRSRS